MEVSIIEHGDVQHDDDVYLAERAGAIRALGKRMVKDICEIGRLLTECKGRVGHGRWLPWLDVEFGWSDKQAERFMSVFKLNSKIDNLSNMTIDASALYLLAAPSSNELRDEVIERAQNGEAITHEQVRELIDKARAESDAVHAANLERLLQQNRTELASREQAVRAEYDGKMIFDEGELAAQIEESVAPLVKKIEAQQKKLDAIHEREEARKKRNGKPPFIDANVSLASTGVRFRLKSLIEETVKIEPRQLFEIEQKATTVTGETLHDRIGEAVMNAETALGWLTEFVRIAKEEMR